MQDVSRDFATRLTHRLESEDLNGALTLVRERLPDLRQAVAWPQPDVRVAVSLLRLLEEVDVPAGEAAFALCELARVLALVLGGRTNVSALRRAVTHALIELDALSARPPRPPGRPN